MIDRGCYEYVQLRLDALERRHREQRLRDPGSEAGQHRPGARELAVCVREKGFVRVEGDESWPTVTTAKCQPVTFFHQMPLLSIPVLFPPFSAIVPLLFILLHLHLSAGR